MSHLILLGDSIFDNAAYTEDGPDVVTQLNAALPDGWAASLLAVDGSTTGDIAGQFGCLPSDATYLVLSVGVGNGKAAGEKVPVVVSHQPMTERATVSLDELFD